VAIEDILIFIKTYPEISKRYTETVCTAGILKRTKNLVRIYPVRYRYLDGKNQFQKYQWINAKISKAVLDPRPESYNVVEESIKLGDIIEPGNDWHEREIWILNENTVYNSVEDLYKAQEDKNISLGLVKPKRIVSVQIEEKTDEEIQSANIRKKSVLSQTDLFEDRKDIDLIPVRFVVNFFCFNPECKGHHLSILDWEFGQLYRKVKNSKDWKDKMIGKVFQLCDSNKETYFILGNMARRQHIFCILGFFYPPKQRNRYLFGGVGDK
jgi:hypothetical protein